MFWTGVSEAQGRKGKERQSNKWTFSVGFCLCVFIQVRGRFQFISGQRSLTAGESIRLMLSCFLFRFSFSLYFFLNEIVVSPKAVWLWHSRSHSFWLWTHNLCAFLSLFLSFLPSLVIFELLEFWAPFFAYFCCWCLGQVHNFIKFQIPLIFFFISHFYFWTSFTGSKISAVQFCFCLCFFFNFFLLLSNL